jgi:hypothetical protein
MGLMAHSRLPDTQWTRRGRLISEVRMRRFDHARDAVDLVATA